MKQLGVFDSAFINLEHPNTPQHVGGLGIYDPITSPDKKLQFNKVLSNFERRLEKHDIFRSSLLRVPAGVDRPYWTLDSNFDIEFHVRHIALPKPGDWRQLCILISQLHSQPLNMSKPLWVTYIIEGVDGIPGVPKNGFAIYTKMHSALIEGAGHNSIMAVLHDLEADPEAVTPGPRTEQITPAPSGLELLYAAAGHSAGSALKLLSGSYSVLKGLGKTALGLGRNVLAMPPLGAPKTRFNTLVGSCRSMAATEFSLAELKKLKVLYGLKTEHVCIALVAGALRRYLSHHQELPQESLAVALMCGAGDRRNAAEGGQRSLALTPIYSEISDPALRLMRIKDGVDGATEFAEYSPLANSRYLSGVFSPALSRPLVNAYIQRRAMRFLPMGISSYVSQVSGPRFPLYCAGASLLRFYGLGALSSGVGLSHFFYSAADVVTVTVSANREAMPDPEFYRECLEEAYQELLLLLKKPTLAAEQKPASAKAARATGNKKSELNTTAPSKLVTLKDHSSAS